MWYRFSFSLVRVTGLVHLVSDYFRRRRVSILFSTSNDHFFSTSGRLFFSLALFWFGCHTVLAQQSVQNAEELRVELATDKRVYRLSEPISVTITLRNVGTEAFHVTAAPRTIRSAAGGTVELQVVDEDGTPVKGKKSFGLFLGFQEESLYEWINRTRRLFQPGDFMGFTRPLKLLGFQIKSPGRYILQAKYREIDYKEWATEQQIEEAKKKLIFPWWSGEIVSEKVSIEIQP